MLFRWVDPDIFCFSEHCYYCLKRLSENMLEVVLYLYLPSPGPPRCDWCLHIQIAAALSSRPFVIYYQNTSSKPRPQYTSAQQISTRFCAAWKHHLHYMLRGVVVVVIIIMFPFVSLLESIDIRVPARNKLNNLLFRVSCSNYRWLSLC
jgi:hypothetical protein